MQSSSVWPTVAFIGGGNMAQAMARGIIHSSGRSDRIFALDRNADTLSLWSDWGARTLSVPEPALSQAKVWILAVKPQQLKAACEQVRAFLCPDTVVLSVAAGVALSTLQRWLGHCNILRSMPNTPALLGKGATGFYADPSVSTIDKALCVQLLSSMGVVEEVAKEALLDAVIAVSGSAPAYVYLMAEALISGAQSMGLSATQASHLALQTIEGAAAMMQNTGDSPEQLRANVSSKGGTTLAALGVFQAQGFTAMVHDAMKAAAQRAAELSQILDKDE